MTGPEHYKEAERLTELVSDPGPGMTMDPRDFAILAVAQVHATLADAAAKVDAAIATEWGIADQPTGPQWAQVTS